MHINVIQAAIFGFLACLASVQGMGGTSIGNYTIGRPLVGGLLVGLVMGDVTTGIIVGAAIQVVYIALVTPGGTMAADVRSISYIGIPLAIMAIKGLGLDPASADAHNMATSIGATVGTLGTVLFYGTVTINLIWQHIGWRAIEKGKLKSVYLVNTGLPWISHILCSFLPAFLITLLGSYVVDFIKESLPMDGIFMKTLLTLGSLLPAVGVAILLKQVMTKPTDILTFVFGFTLAACLHLNLIGCAIIGGFFAVFNYQIKMLSIKKAAVAGGGSQSEIPSEIDDEEEDI